jgi:hypothetical protein
LFDRADLRPDMAILDTGEGTGSLSNEFAQRFGADARVIVGILGPPPAGERPDRNPMAKRRLRANRGTGESVLYLPGRMAKGMMPERIV